MFLALLLATRPAAAECTGDLIVVLVDPQAYKEANDHVLGAITSVGRGISHVPVIGWVGDLINFPLSISSLEAFGWAQRATQDWMDEMGIEGTVAQRAVPHRPSGWLHFDSGTGQIEPDSLVLSKNPAVFWLDVDIALWVHVDRPKQAAKAASGRGIGLFPRSPREQANAAVFNAMATSVMMERHMDAFVHLGEDACE